MDARAASHSSHSPHSLGSLITTYAGGAGIPLPARGQTLSRWRVFAQLAAAHGAVAIKLFEAHADALAILAELVQATPEAQTKWAVWAAEPPDARVRATPSLDAASVRAVANAVAAAAGIADTAQTTFVQLTGRKAWCSGASEVSHALLTCHDDDGASRLAVVDLHGPGIAVTTEGWHAVGMADTCSGDVLLESCPALLIGSHRAYLDRPGFWHGGAGIAACWYGAALPLAQAVQDVARRRDDPHAAAHLGAIDGDLGAAAALLRETAAWIDAHPDADGFVPAMRVRTVVEAAVQRVLRRAGNVLGAGPLCRDQRLASLHADLPVFLRQSHAERDLAALGRARKDLTSATSDYAL